MASVANPELSVSELTEKQTLTGGEALVQMLARNGVDTLFGLPGVQLDGFFGALYDANGLIRVIHTRHEQATAYMADGYARVTGKEGVFAVVPGPGVLNTTAALSTAYACNSPVLCVTGQIQSNKIGVGTGLLHEIPDQLALMRGVTKHAARAMTPGEVPGLVEEAFRQLRTGRPRPVEIEVPQDTLFAKADLALPAPVAPRARFAGNPDLIEKAAKALGQAKKPAIFAGGGILRSQAWEELRLLAEMLEAPVVVSNNAKGAISSRHYLQHGWLAATETFDEADVILAVATRFTNGFGPERVLHPGQVLIQLDIDTEEIGRNVKPTIGIEADAKAGLAALINAVGKHNSKRASRKDELTARKAHHEGRANSVLPQAAFGAAIRAELPDDGIWVSEMTQLGYWGSIGFPVYEPNTWITQGYQGTLGAGFTTALGAKVGKPNTPVISVNGDGGFGFTLNELGTMAQHQIGVVAVVFNDSAYGNVRRMQVEDYNNRLIASDLKNPDFMKLADAYSVRGYRCETPEKLQAALKESFAKNEPTLIEVPVGPMPNPWKVLGLR